MFRGNVISVAVVVILAAVTGTNAQCSGRTNIYVPEYNDCCGFYYCNSYGVITSTPTPCDANAGYMWSQRHQVCDHSDNVDCYRDGNYWIRTDALADGSEAFCYGHGSDKLEDATSCKRYFQCHMDMGRIEQCPPDYYFRKLSGECVQFRYLEPQRQEYCALIHDLVIEYSTDCPQHGMQRMTCPDDCTQYYYCYTGSRCTIYCPEGMYYDDVSTLCVSHDALTGVQQTRCSDMGIVIDDGHDNYNGGCSKGFTGSIQDPNSCMTYERCINGYSTLVHCDVDLYYNPQIGVCTREDQLDDYCRAECGLSVETCYSDSVAILFDVNDCGRVILCVHYHATVYQCPYMEVFSRELLKCVPATGDNSVHCAINHVSECTSEMFTILSTDDGCSRAEVCVYGNKYIQECTICGQVVSSSILACREPTADDIYRCSLNLPNGPTQNPSCNMPSQSYYYAGDNADSSNKFYYKCNAYNAEMHFKCPGELHYSSGYDANSGYYNPSCA